MEGRVDRGLHGADDQLGHPSRPRSATLTLRARLSRLFPDEASQALHVGLVNGLVNPEPVVVPREAVEPHQAPQVVSLHACEQLGNLSGDRPAPLDGGLSEVDELVRGNLPDVLQLVTEDLPEGLRVAVGAAVAEVAIEPYPVDVGVSWVPDVRGRRVLASCEVAVLM